jgi:ATP-dependent helicase HepA
MVSEAELLVRWGRDLADPTDVLVVRGHESAYFHNCRHPFIASLTRQRAACRGLRSILSASIQFYEHQLTVAHRVLLDPVQRYLLADEVGLGKTIEAGLVIRQYLLDRPGGYVLIIAPEPLRAQWVRELKYKFHVDDLAEARIKVMAHDAWQQWGRYGMPEFLVVDEAHQLVAGIGDGSSDFHSRYSALEGLARAARCLLLLSATPLLHNETSFLAMLHLLDPALHGLQDHAAFEQLVASRQELGRLFYTFKATTPDFLLEEKISRLRVMFPKDVRLRELLDNVTAAINSSDTAQLEDSILRARIHISEVYRLHRRLLRTRRTEEVLDSYPVRGRKLPAALADTDPRRPMVDAWLEALREQLNLEAAVAGGPVTDEAAGEVFWLFLEWAGSDLAQLLRLVDVALHRRDVSVLTPDLNTADAQTIISVVDSSAHLKALLEELQQSLGSNHDADRTAICVSFLRGLPKVNRAVVFSRFHLAARRLGESLEVQVGTSGLARQLHGMSAPELAEELARFESSPFCRFLICDSVAEEGINLQSADLLVHFDLHFNPNRLEQRLGRIDRYSGRRPVDSFVFQADPRMTPGFHTAWLTCLLDGFQVFEASIASTQYAVDRLISTLRNGALTTGAEALRNADEEIRATLEAEATIVSEQDALDGIEAMDSDSKLYADLSDLEDHWRDLKRATEDWASDAKGSLRFDKEEDDQERQIVNFGFNRGGREPDLSSMPLVGWDVLAEHFALAVRRDGSFHRETALRHPGTRVFRLGEPFTDALYDFTRWDDRGRAFALVRTRDIWSGNPHLPALRFDYLIEGNIQPLSSILAADERPTAEQRRLARARVDAWFKPMVTTVWLTTELERIHDKELLSLLEEPYAPERGDVNLSWRRDWFVDKVIGRDRWEPLVRGASVESKRQLIHGLELAAKIRDARAAATRQSALALGQLRSRAALSALPGTVIDDPVDVEHEQALADAVVAGVGDPVIRLDSIGLVILTAQHPTGAGFEQSEDADD